MTISIDVSHSLGDITKTFKELEKAIPKAAKSALKRTLKTLVDQSQKRVRERYKIKRSTLVKNHFKESVKLQGSTLAAMRLFEANLGVKDKDISLMEFVKGSKVPKSQKGIKVKRRRTLRVEVTPGRSIGLMHAFLAKGKGGRISVFHRKGKASLPISRGMVPSVHHMFERPEFRKPIEDYTGEQLQKEFKSALQIHIERLRVRNGT